MLTPTIMDLTQLSQNFPSLDERTIEREYVIDTLSTMFSGNHLVVVEGVDDIGKTVLLAQFVKQFPQTTFSLFVSYTSRWAYDAKILLLDLFKQVHWAVHHEYFAEDHVEDTSLSLLFSKLRERARLTNTYYYFVVDGLDEIPSDDLQTQRLILDLLPFGNSQFRFLIAGDHRQITQLIPGRISSKAYTLSGFTSDEAVRYMKDLVNEPEHIKDLYLLCGRMPGRLSSVRRLLSAGVTIEAILSGNPTQPLHFLELEWSRVNEADDITLTALSILAHNIRKHSVMSLAHVIGSKEDYLAQILGGLSFIQIDSVTGEIEFVSQPFRRFVANKLAERKGQANELVIADLLKTPDSPEALTYLPVLFEEQGQYDSILHFLSAQHFAKVLTASESLVPIKHKADLGIEAARKLGYEADLVKFSVQKSALAELDTSEEWRAEIEARVALNDYEAAMALAQSVVLKDDRLHLLAIIARKKRENGVALDDELISQIRQLYEEVDHMTLSQRSNNIAEDLIFSLPELAIELVEKTSDVEKGENGLDWALATLSIRTTLASAESANSKRSTDLETSDRIRSRIKDPKARSLTTAMSLLVKDYSSDEIIAEVERLEGTTDRLFLLRQWARANRHHERAADIVEYALATAIRSTPYTFNATVLRELAIPLPFIEDTERAKQLVGAFDSQQGTVEPLGPTEDFVRLQLLLARAEMRREFNAALNRITDVYLRVSSIEDLDLKATCLAWLASSLATMDPDHKFEEEQAGRIHSAVNQELTESLDQLRASTADQYEATKGVINALARYKPDLAVNVAMSLNTKYRRNAALVDYFESALEAPIKDIDFGVLNSHLAHFTEADARDLAVLKIIEFLWANSPKTAPIMASVLPIVRKLGDVRNAVERCRGCSLAYVLVMTADPTQSSFGEALLKYMEEAWSAIDIGWVRTQAGFQASATIAKYSPQKAREYLARTEKDRDRMKMSFGGSAQAYSLALRLALRSYSGLLPRNVHTTDDLSTLGELIDIIPARVERASLWAELAVRYFLADQSSDSKRIVNEHLLPLLTTVSNADEFLRMVAVTAAAPALYCAHHQLALSTIAELPSGDRELPYMEILFFVLRKVVPNEPFDDEGSDGYNITYEDMLDLCVILDLMTWDWNIYSTVKSLADTMVSTKYGRRFSRSQKQTIVEKLRAIVSTKLPNPDNITHDGFKIASNIHLNRIETSIGSKSSASWDSLAQEVSSIPNLADRSYVQAILASALPARDSARRNRLFDLAKHDIDLIPAVYDRVNHYESLASITAKPYQALARKCVEDAMKLCINSNDRSLDQSQRRLIDLAYKLDPNLASSFADLIDDDPAKVIVKQNLRRQIAVHKLRNRMLEHSSQHANLTSSDKREFPQAAWQNLKALNSNRIANIKTEYTRDWVQAAASLPLTEAYPIIAWVIENAVRRLAKTDQARTHLRSLFDAIIDGAKLCGQMTTRSLLIAKKSNKVVQASQTTSLLIRAGERDKALGHLKEWFAGNIGEYLKVCDPYFGPEDLEVLQLIRSAKPECHVQILTSRKHNEALKPSFEEAFRSHWKSRFDQAAPNATIVLAGTDLQGQFPIHDRWWIVENGGLRIGTSYNSLGVNRDSEISRLTAEEAHNCEVQVDQYLTLRKREHQGRKMLYSVFIL